MICKVRLWYLEKLTQTVYSYSVNAPFLNYLKRISLPSCRRSCFVILGSRKDVLGLLSILHSCLAIWRKRSNLLIHFWENSNIGAFVIRAYDLSTMDSIIDFFQMEAFYGLSVRSQQMSHDFHQTCISIPTGPSAARQISMLAFHISRCSVVETTYGNFSRPYKISGWNWQCC